MVNADDPNAEILGGVNLEARRVAFAMEPGPTSTGMIDVQARLARIDGSGTRMLLHGFDREAAVHLPLLGPRAATCALAAAALAWAMDIDRASVVEWARGRPSQSPGTSRRSPRARISTSGSTPPERPTPWLRPWPFCGPSRLVGFTLS